MANRRNSDHYILGIQLSWLETRFQTSNCKVIANEISKHSSFNQIIPFFEHGPWRTDEDLTPFKPIQLADSKFQHLTTEDKWLLYRQAFKNLTYFREFKNLRHINHDPVDAAEDVGLCEILQIMPSIESATIRYRRYHNLPLTEKEVNCVIDKKIQIFIIGEFIPDSASNKLKNRIFGIENFLGDIKTLHGYKNLKYLGMKDYSGASNLTELARIKNLSHLHFNVANIISHEDISLLSHLKYLSINCYERDSEGKKIKCKNNRIKDINFIRPLKRLKGLDLSLNEIQDISAISDLKSLEILNLKNNKISNLAPIETLYSLKYLDISANFISEIGSLRKLTKLKLLNMSDNLITNFGYLTKLSSLKYLAAGRNPYTLQNFNPTKSLKVLNLNGLPYFPELSYLKHSIDTSFESSDEYNWTRSVLFEDELSIKTTEFKSPIVNRSLSASELKKIKNVHHLSLAHSGLSKNLDFSNFKNLKYLNLESNNLESSSEKEIFPRGLESLILKNNQIKKLSFVRNLKSLKHLDLSSNKLEVLDFDFDLPKLEELHLSDCDLHVSPTFSELPKIRRLHMNHNLLKSIDIQKLLTLEQLYLVDNNIEVFPNFTLNYSLTYVVLAMNKIKNFDNIDSLTPYFQFQGSEKYYRKVDINLIYNNLGDLSFFNDSRFDYFNIDFRMNPIDKQSAYLCPKDSPNVSVRQFCSSP